MSHHQKAGKYYYNNDNDDDDDDDDNNNKPSYEILKNVSKFRYFGITVTNQNHKP